MRGTDLTSTLIKHLFQYLFRSLLLIVLMQSSRVPIFLSIPQIHIKVLDLLLERLVWGGRTSASDVIN